MIKKLTLASVMLLSVAQAKDYGTVNGDKITDADIAMTIGQTGMSYDVLDKTMKKRVIDMIVDRKLLSQAAAKSGIEKTETYRTQLELLKKGLVLDSWMKNELDIIEKGLSESKLKAEYKKNKTKYSTAKKLQARHILLKTEDEAKALIKELDAATDKKAKFIELAKIKSTGPSGKNGGDLGWFELGRMVPEFSAAADKLKVGAYTKIPVKTQFGFHLIMLDGKKEASVKPFDVVKEAIKKEMSSKAFTTMMKAKTKALRKDAKIELK